MGSIAVVHHDLKSIGGAEAVCMNILEALQSQHDLYLITFEGADIDRLNQAFNTKVEPEEITIHQPRIFSILSKAFPKRFSILKDALRYLYLDLFLEDVDLVFSTKNEMYLDSFTLHYVHKSSFPDYINPNPQTVLREIYLSLSHWIGGLDESKVRNDVFLANSGWTATSLSEYYGVEPTVVYPPIDTARFTDQAWEDRESGFLCIGEIDPRKNILENIDIIAELWNRNHDVHLHIIGPINSRDYYRKVADRADDYDFIHIEGELSFEDINDMIDNHKYGIHGMSKEPFGMVVAEMIAGGMIPFVPNGGGQVEVVNKEGNLIYSSPSEAVKKTEHVISDLEVQQEIKGELEEMKTAFTKDRFHNEIRDIVDRTIDEQKSGNI